MARYMSTVASDDMRSAHFAMELQLLREHSWEFINDSNNCMSFSSDETDDLLSAVLSEAPLVAQDSFSFIIALFSYTALFVFIFMFSLFACLSCIVCCCYCTAGTNKDNNNNYIK